MGAQQPSCREPEQWEGSHETAGGQQHTPAVLSERGGTIIGIRHATKRVGMEALSVLESARRTVERGAAGLADARTGGLQPRACALYGVHADKAVSKRRHTPRLSRDVFLSRRVRTQRAQPNNQMCQCVWSRSLSALGLKGACHGSALQGPEPCRPGDKKQNTRVVDGELVVTCGRRARA